MKRLIFPILILISLTSRVWGQQVPMYGQYIFNSTVINSAQAGSGADNQAGFSGRYQWVGIDGAPITHTAFANMILPANLGIAAGLFQDQAGPLKEITLQADIAHTTQLSREWFMSGGLRVVTSSMTIDLSALNDLASSGDPMLNMDVRGGFRLNMGAGLLFYSKNHFVGLSMPRSLKVMNKRGHAMSHHFFFYGGSHIEINREITITPSMLFKGNQFAPAQLDINLMTNYDLTFDFGPMIRSNLAQGWVDAIGFAAGYNINQNWYFGYMYEYPVNPLSTATRQTHEISLRYQWLSMNNNYQRKPSFFLNDRRRR